MSDKGASVELLTLYRLGREREMSDKLEEMAVQDIAGAMSKMPADTQLRVLLALPRERRAGAFSYLSHGIQQQVISDLEPDQARTILRELVPDDRTAFLESLAPSELEGFLKLLGPDDLNQSLKLLGYPEESVGRLMTTRYVSVRPEWSVNRALDHIRHEAHRGETVNYVFVTDKGGKLLDAIRLKDFILARQDARVEVLMDDDVIHIEADADREQAVQTIQHYDISTLPVTDRGGVLLGIVTVDDIMDVAEAEITEDFHKFGGSGRLNISMREASPTFLYRKRIGWLMVLVIVNLFSGLAISFYEQSIEAVIGLVFFLPMIIAGSGNAGSQSATLMVRALATGDVAATDWLKMWGKELSVAVMLGLTMASAVALIGAWRGGTEIGQELALVVGLSMFAVVIMGGMIGVLLPFLLQRLNLDPATASTPLITSVADVGGILIYFSIASAVLSLPSPVA
ncbi:magnesium transporter [Wenzhouxiangella sp. EGI_FJ10409]|uniref:magnesium transporter n=1 Tax=Wenzhouxiangella sp. EGI_FJ10409 TaxID=3243767 RepID=UPI0035DEE03A